MAFKVKAGEVVNEPNVVPMCDIMLVLLIIFMVVTPMLQKGFSVELARVSNPLEMQNADKEDAVVIAVAADGTTYLGATKITRAEITAQVRDMLSSKLDKTVYVKSDARARYGDVVAVVDEVRAAGVDQLGLLTDKVEKARPAPPSGGSGQN